uniref:Uncharacterized protein n=1 Tax=Tanacetum cinerariifolium TaxID=118510 RepID=A0A6L2LB69_TANCI|nr:hypothetical protein [Tanacetum cinerariifolium]
MIPDLDGAANINGTVKQILESLSKITKGNKKQYIIDVKVMNYFLQAIPNDLYNSVDACKKAKEMQERIKRLMFGSDVTRHVRHSCLMDEFDKFAAKEGESLEFVYEILIMLVNIMDRNNVHPILVSINTKNQDAIQDGRVDMQTKNAGYGGNADGNAETVPSYDAKAVSEVNASSKVHEQMRHEKPLELMLLKTSKIYAKGLRLLVEDLLLLVQIDALG